jgi:sortase B
VPSGHEPAEQPDDDYYEEYEGFIPIIDFDAFREDFPDAAAWLRIEGTVIDYPVVQGRDNDFYLSRLPDKTPNAMGSIFLDYRSSPDFTDANTLIYGHHMRAGDMFGSIKNYSRQSFFDEHPTGTIFTPERDYQILFFASYVLDSTREVPPMDFANEAEFNSFIREVKQRSAFRSGVEVVYGDRLVSLCTCEYSAAQNRQILVGKLAEIG